MRVGVHSVAISIVFISGSMEGPLSVSSAAYAHCVAGITDEVG
jgi:hypothetical protein